MPIKRYMFSELVAHLPKKELSLIVGPRQAGKTTLMLQVQDYLKKKNEKTLFLSLDFEGDTPHFNTQAALLDRINLEFGKKKGYVFIDEIQRKENAGIFLKGLYDMQTPYKFVVSGSGSIELKEKVHESLAGRKRMFELQTVSLKEFINYKTMYKYEDRLEEYFRIEKTESLGLLIEYLNFGGYPRVILEETLAEKLQTMDEIYRSYIEKDIAYLLRVERIDAFGNLLRLLAGQAGNIINLNEISSTVGISVQTVKNYLYYAEKTFVIKRLTPYYRNIRKEISKSPVVYFNDIGMRNFSIGQFGRYMMLSEMGFLFQNLIYRLLHEKIKDEGSTLHFWRTKDRAEVDFVINKGREVIPVEVKCKEMKEKSIARSLRSFISRYKPKEAFVVNISLKDEDMIEKTKIRFIPYFELI
ncbi:MAG: ATPase [Nitrospinae bacterium RIFCSPLOWO2_01_FULL_39_10]|nr:MAG: ATPase [Nitrospinae bacterium RIFCSPLOWO2_01_FULL_39_10]